MLPYIFGAALLAAWIFIAIEIRRAPFMEEPEDLYDPTTTCWDDDDEHHPDQPI